MDPSDSTSTAPGRLAPPRASRVLALAAALAALGAAAVAVRRVAATLRGPESVVLFVLDDVRADHTSLCGYNRPTTPHLQALAQAGAAYTCGGVAPGSWTLPSHASFFTGVPVLDHGAHELPIAGVEAEGGIVAPGTGIPTRPLDDRLPTLAEAMKARGYQPRLISMNPVLGAASGLQRGFDEPLFVARGFHGVKPIEATTLALRSLDPDGGPLFLVVNLTQAHQPWLGVPDGLGWVHPQAGLDYQVGRADNPWTRWYHGDLSETERSAFLDQLRDNYDYGIHQADESLGRVLDLLTQSGWCGDACRVVVTSDHGELLGEGGLIDHGFYVAEGNARVPILVRGAPGLVLPDVLSGVFVYNLLSTGALPELAQAAEQPAWAHPARYQATEGRYYGSTSAARWDLDGTKTVWQDGVLSRYNLKVDPQERAPQPAAADPDFQRFVDRVRQVDPRDATLDPEVIQMLQAGGYLGAEAGD